MYAVLSGSENAVPGIAKTGNNIALRIEVIINGSGVDIHIGMRRLHLGDAFRSADKVEAAYLAATVALQQLDGRDKRTARGQHGVKNDGEALIKKFQLDGKTKILRSFNPDFEPFVAAKDFRVEGEVKAVISRKVI